MSNIWEGVKTTMVGMKITVPYIWKKPVTTMYPHQRLQLPERARNRLYVNMDDCIGCDQCSRACPVNCITIETAKAVEGDMPGVTSNGKKKALWVTRFDIDIAKCCYCGLCVFPCPTECIKMTDVFEFSEQERNNLIYNYITLTPEEIQEKIEKSKQAEEAGAKKPAPAAAAGETSAPKPAAAPANLDPEKAAKLAELQAKMAAAKAAKGGEAPAAPKPATPPIPPGTDPEKAAKLAELQAKMAAARAQREAASGDAPAPPSAPAPPPVEASASDGGASDEDAEKAARVAAMKAKIAEAKARKEGGA